MKSINIEHIINLNNNNQSSSEIISNETAQFMQNQRSTENWCSDALSTTVVNIIERHEHINERLQTTSIADILAGIQFDDKSKDSAPFKKENFICRKNYTDGLIDIEPTLTETPNTQPHWTYDSKKTRNASHEDSKGDAKVWKDTSVFYNNPFDPQITFEGLNLKRTTKTKNTGYEVPFTGYPDTFNSFLDILNPTGFANSYLQTYQQYLRDLRNESRQLAQDDDPFKISVRQDENKMFDKIETGLNPNDAKVNDAPCFVGNECENIDMWSQITATRRFWLEDEKRQESTKINDDTSTKSLLVALFLNSTEDLQSNPSKQQVDNEQDAVAKSDTESMHLQPELPEQRPGIHDKQARTVPQSRILPHLLNLHKCSDSETAQALANIMNQGDAPSDDFTTDNNNRITSSNGLVDGMAGTEDVRTNNAEVEGTIWAPTEAGDFMGTSCVPPFNPWSTVHVDYLEKPIVAAQTSMFWSHQQRCRQQHQQQQQQQTQHESQLQADRATSDQNKQDGLEQQENKQQPSTDLQQNLDNHMQQKQQQQQQLQEEQQQCQQQHNQPQHQVHEVYYHHNQQSNIHQHHLFQNQYQNQYQSMQQTQLIQQQNQLKQPSMQHEQLCQQYLQEQQQLAHNQQPQQPLLQKNYQQTHQYNSQIRPGNHMHPMYHHQQQQQQQQQRLPHPQLHPNNGLFDQQGSVQNQRNKTKNINIQHNAGQNQWSETQQNYEQGRASRGNMYVNGVQPNLSQHAVNIQQSQHYAQYSGRPAYQTGAYYPGVYPQYSTSTSMNGGQHSTNHSINGNSTNRYSTGSVANLNFIHSTPQQSYVQFDDEVWYINGIPHQHAKPVQSNENVELPPNKHYWPQIYGPMPNVAPPSYASGQSYQSMSGNDNGLNVKSNNQQNAYNTEFQNTSQNNNKNNNAEVDNSMRNSFKDRCTFTDVGSETWSINSLASSKSQHSLFRMTDDASEIYVSETPDSLSEFSDAEGEEEHWFDYEKSRDQLDIVEISNDAQEDHAIYVATSKVTRTEDFIGRQIKVLSSRPKANREKQLQPRKPRNNRASHLIQII